MHPSYQAPPQSERQVFKQSSDHQQLSSEALLGANTQMAALEPEVRDLKRKLTTAESGELEAVTSAVIAKLSVAVSSPDLVQNPPSLHHEITADASQLNAPAKRSKHIPSVSSHATSATPVPTPTPRAESSPATGFEKKVCEIAAASPADATASELGEMSSRNKAFGVARAAGAREATRMADDGVDNALLKRLPGRKADDGVEGGCRSKSCFS